MRLSRRVAAASAVAVIALMTMLLPTQAFLGIDQANDTGANGAAVIDQEPAQSFTPTYGSLGAVDIFLLSWEAGPTINAFTLEVEIFTGGGTFIGQSNVPISVGFTGGVVQAQFSPPLALVPGDTYVIALNTPDGSSFEDQLRWQFVQGTPSGPYGGGGATLDYNSAVPFVATQTYDFMFRTYLDDVTPPVVTPVITPPSATAPWWNTDVNLTWTVVENDSPVTLTGCATTDILVDQPVTAYTCQATSVGGASAVVSVDIGRDTVKPVITATRTLPNADG